jgi:hypothetical protein
MVLRWDLNRSSGRLRTRCATTWTRLSTSTSCLGDLPQIHLRCFRGQARGTRRPKDTGCRPGRPGRVSCRQPGPYTITDMVKRVKPCGSCQSVIEAPFLQNRREQRHGGVQAPYIKPRRHCLCFRLLRAQPFLECGSLRAKLGLTSTNSKYALRYGMHSYTPCAMLFLLKATSGTRR